jgi:hypothetical protein
LKRANLSAGDDMTPASNDGHISPVLALQDQLHGGTKSTTSHTAAQFGGGQLEIAYERRVFSISEGGNTPMDSTGVVTVRWPFALISIRKPT